MVVAISAELDTVQHEMSHPFQTFSQYLRLAVVEEFFARYLLLYVIPYRYSQVAAAKSLSPLEMEEAVEAESAERLFQNIVSEVNYFSTRSQNMNGSFWIV